MSLLSARELINLVESGIICGVADKDINASSIDLHLAEAFLVEAPQTWGPKVIDIAKREQPHMIRYKGRLVLEPGDFCLASTTETFYLPEYISGLFMLKSSLARVGLEHSQAGWCLSGDTLIELLDGSSKAIKDITPGDWVYSLNDAGDFVPGLVEWQGVTGHASELVDVTLDNDRTFSCTTNHRVMMRDGSFLEAKDLSAGMALMPHYTRKDADGYVQVYSPSTANKGKWRSLVGRWDYVHRIVRDVVHGRVDASVVAHHQDEDPTNNHPDNIELMSEAEHIIRHTIARNKSDKQRGICAEKMRETSTALWKDPAYRKAKIAKSRENAVAWNERLWSSDEHRKSMLATQQANGRAVMAKMGQTVMQRKAKIGMVTTVIRKILEHGESVTAENYAKHKRQNAPTLSTLEQVFGGFEAAVAEAGYANHKVKCVVFRKVDDEPVYDLTIRDHHNFALSAGCHVHNCDAGWHGSALTLELSNALNYHSLLLTSGMAIGQVVLFSHTPVPESYSYATKGRYNNDKIVSGIKP